MTKNELIQSLEKWKNNADPEGRVRNFSITKHKDKEGEHEHVSIGLDKVYTSFDFSVNYANEIIIEEFQAPTLSGYIKLEKFIAYLETL